MDDPLWKALIGFTQEETGSPLFGKPLPLSTSTRVFEDLGIDGVDAIEFIDRLFEQFDIAGDFPYARYFGAESPSNVLFAIPALIGALFNRTRMSETNAHSLTLGMLLEAMRTGRWDTASIEANQLAGARAETGRDAT